MKRTTRNSGFTLIELMIVVAIIAIIAAIAIPKLMSARISANENAAISTLRAIAAAQHQLESACAIDSDADGGGEFGYFGELAGVAEMRTFEFGTGAVLPADSPDDILDPPILPTAFGDVIAGPLGGIVERQGYYFQMWLPGPTASGAVAGIPEVDDVGGGADGGALPDSNNCEILWCCYAWPVEPEKTGNRVFFINQEGDLIQTDNREQTYDGLVTAPEFDAAFSEESALDMGSSLGLTAMGLVANDGLTWTTVGN